ncbi:hypothetical protein P5673_013215 [Acropora cervicornis]|uniref:Uncharacterized protein n=1 Tax=Acropora cervicornis TaxID=6130 RepID=A0AAD9QLK8_ACRCE|nr:hypothetical protein P5673_013215 [Acropora cervicornis]
MKPVLVVAVILSLFIFSECYITILDRSTLRKVKKFSKDCVEMRRSTGTWFFRSRRKRRRFRLQEGVCVQLRDEQCSVVPEPRLTEQNSTDTAH